MIKTFYIIIFYLFSYCTIFSQVGGTDQFRDSLKHELVIAKNDTSRVLIMAQLASAYNGFYPDTVNLYGNEALKLTERINYPRGKARALIALGLGIQLEGEYPKSFDYLYRSLEIAEEERFILETAICYSSIGNNYWFLEDYSRAVEIAKKSQDLFKSIINYEEAPEWMRFNLLLIGQSYLEYQLDSSYEYLSQFYDATINDKFWHPVALSNLGDCLFRRGDRRTSFKYTMESIAGAIENGDNLSESEACATMAVFFKKIQESDSSIYYAHKGLDAANSIAYRLGIYKNSKLLAEEYEKLDVRKALYYRKIYDSVNESMYGARKVQELQKTLAEEQHRQQQIQQAQVEKENRLKQYGFMGGLAAVLLIAFFLYRNNLQKKKANILLQSQKEKVETTLTELKSTQAQLIQSEKMASLGELTAGIAHEIQNPLNFVNNFSDVNSELIAELKEEIDKGNMDEVKEIANNIEENEQKINHHGRRADSIVKGMLQHSQTSTRRKEPTDINALCDEYLRLAYHGLRAKEKSFNATIKTDFDGSIGNIDIIPQDIGRVLLNLYNNAFYAVHTRAFAEAAAVNEKSSSANLSTEASADKSAKAEATANNYEPTISISTGKQDNKIVVGVKDNGNGIPKKVVDKIFQPFFTTKPTGQGTGLGLSLSYDIIKAHGGEIKVKTVVGEGAEFIITLPVN